MIRFPPTLSFSKYRFNLLIIYLTYIYYWLNTNFNIIQIIISYADNLKLNCIRYIEFVYLDTDDTVSTYIII